MRSDAIAVELRPRSAWEAIDLGLELARAWFRPLAIAWLVAYVIPALLAVAISPWPLLTAAAAWLLRPWAERALVEVLARRAFHQPTTLGLALRAVLRAPFRPGAWLAGVTWRRCSAVRVAWLAVWQLEGLRGRAARTRVRVLTAQGWGACAWCSLIGWAATILLSLSGVVVALTLVPDATGAGVREWLEGDVPLALRQRRTWALLLVAADAACAPWVLAAQFGWYLSRRTELEAWDIELVFRALARRVAASAAVLVVALVVATDALHAQPAPPPSEQASSTVRETSAEKVPFDPRTTIDAILADPAFGRDEVVQQWRLRPWSDAPVSRPSPWLAWLMSRIGTLAGLLRWAMWIAAAVMIAWLARLAWRGRPHGSHTDADVPQTQLEFDVPQASRDVHVVRAATEAIEQGRLLEALGWLYRGAIHACTDRGVIDVRPGDTEGEYLRQIAGRLPHDTERTVRTVVRAWQGAAYARRVPAADDVRAMCEAYRLHVAGDES